MATRPHRVRWWPVWVHRAAQSAFLFSYIFKCLLSEMPAWTEMPLCCKAQRGRMARHTALLCTDISEMEDNQMNRHSLSFLLNLIENNVSQLLKQCSTWLCLTPHLNLHFYHSYFQSILGNKPNGPVQIYDASISPINGDQPLHALTLVSQHPFDGTTLKRPSAFQCCSALSTKPEEVIHEGSLHAFTWCSCSSARCHSSVCLDWRNTTVCGSTTGHRSSSLHLRCAFPLCGADGGQRIWGVGLDVSIIQQLGFLCLSNSCQAQCHRTGERSQHWWLRCRSSCMDLERKE